MFRMGTTQSQQQQSVSSSNLANFYNKNADQTVDPYQMQQAQIEDFRKIDKFSQVLNQKIVDTKALQNLSWQGIPSDFRSTVWKLLLRYQSPNRDAAFAMIDRKRTQYYEMCSVYFATETNELYDENERKIIKLIQQDVIRNNPGALVFRNTTVQGMLQKILFIWNVRNPACGYVQGINDIVSIFLVVFLSDYVDIELKDVKIKQKQKHQQLSFENEKQMEHLDRRLKKQVEADTYWCLTKILDTVIDNYTQDQPGQVRQYNLLWKYLQKLDKGLCDHLESECKQKQKYKSILEIDLYRGFVFKWNNCLLLRLFSFPVGLRLFDTLIAEEQSNILHTQYCQDYFEFCVYIIATILLKFSKKIISLQFDEIMSFLEKMPTKHWSEYELSLCLAEAYSYKQILKDL